MHTKKAQRMKTRHNKICVGQRKCLLTWLKLDFTRLFDGKKVTLMAPMPQYTVGFDTRITMLPFVGSTKSSPLSPILRLQKIVIHTSEICFTCIWVCLPSQFALDVVFSCFCVDPSIVLFKYNCILKPAYIGTVFGWFTLALLTIFDFQIWWNSF